MWSSLNLFITCSLALTMSESSPVSSPKSCDSMDPTKYEHIIIRGLPYDRGFSYGVQAKEKILRNLEYYSSSKTFLPWPECLDFVTKNYMNATQKYFPGGFQEMRGIADGSGTKIEEIMILSARYELSRVYRARLLKKKRTNTTIVQNAIPEQANECTGTVALSSATKSGDVIIGQNWDIHQFILKNDTAILLEVHPDPSENIQPFIMLTEAGQLGRTGMNSNGLGVIAMSLWSSGDIFERDPEDHPNGWVPVTLVRRMFLEARTFPLGLAAILKTPRHVSVNMIIATSEDEALNLELTPNNYFVMNVPLDKEFLTHSNHFKTPHFLARDDIQEGSRGSSSLFRDRRIAKTLQRFWPNITEETFEEAFKDHVGFPDSVCVHAASKDLSTVPGTTTVASVIYNLSKRTLKLCKGPPCEGIYTTYSLVQNTTTSKTDIVN